MRSIYQNIAARIATICGRAGVITLAPATVDVLSAIGHGATLKAHRTIDGNKVHKLHPLQGDAVLVPSAVVRTLEQRGWVRSNMKFPAATYLLTDKGRQALLRLEQ